jgi:hypothetical protein
MSLSPDQKFGPYTLIAPLGEGGMGEVWKARDTRIDRTVALKVAKADFGERSEREARAVAALNHPNICTLYDVGPNYLVMELIEGESPKGPLPLETALGYARQIADALEAAHEKGIVHRDLKPANIKITGPASARPGTVKVLDFGLAKTVETASGDPESSPTVTISAMRAGTIMGTAAYMSPEQARGRKVDKRADIWAFGVVLYEMLTGRMLFQGEDLSETLASVVRDTPDLSAAPAPVRRLLESCLEKDPKKRLRDIGDAWRLLEEPAIPAAASTHAGRWVWGASAALALAAIAGWLRPGSAGNEPAMALSIVPPAGITLTLVGNQLSAPELSPDGSAILYEAGHRMYVRRLDSLYPRLVPGQADNPPFWSADSTTVVYTTDIPAPRTLTKVRIPDGAPELVSALPGAPRGGSWSDAGTILIAVAPCLTFIPASGGAVKPVEMPGPLKEGSCFYPEFLPGGQDFLFEFVPSRDPDDAAVYLAALRDGKAVDPRLLLKNQTAARYTPAGGGRILFVRNDNLYSQKLNRRTRQLEGEAELAAQGVASQPSMVIFHADFSVARNGTIAWRPGKAAASQVTEFDRSGKPIGTSGPPGSYAHLALSPDERQFLVSSSESGWLVDVGQSGRSELPKGMRWFGWFAGGAKLMGIRNGALVEMSASGTGEVHELRKVGLEALGPPRISSDGRQVIANTEHGIVWVPLEGTPDELNPKVVERAARTFGSGFSPDGRWLVCYTVGSEGGLYVQPFPGPGARRQIAPGGATNPLWRKDGKEILYRNGDALMSVAVEWKGAPAFGAPRKLFSGLRWPAGSTAAARPLAAWHDGSRIFWLQGVEQPDSNVIHVKTGWLK